MRVQIELCSGSNAPLAEAVHLALAAIHDVVYRLRVQHAVAQQVAFAERRAGLHHVAAARVASCMRT